MPAVFDKMGIRFQYPDNWSLDEEEALGGNSSVTVISPQGAFWSITLHPRGTDPKDLADTALRALKAEYQDSEAEPAVEQIGERSISGFDFSFFYLDLTSTALIRAFRTSSLSCLVLCQAEDRELEQLGPIFHAMTTSLLNESD